MLWGVALPTLYMREVGLHESPSQLCEMSLGGLQLYLLHKNRSDPISSGRLAYLPCIPSGLVCPAHPLPGWLHCATKWIPRVMLSEVEACLIGHRLHSVVQRCSQQMLQSDANR